MVHLAPLTAALFRRAKPACESGSSAGGALSDAPCDVHCDVLRRLPAGRQEREVNTYRWLILAAGTLSSTSLAAVQIGISAIAPELRAYYGLSIGQIGVVLGATTAGMTVTLLPWGIVSDRIGERLAIVIGLGGAAIALGFAARADGFAALVVALFGDGGVRRVRELRERPRGHALVCPRRARSRARDPPGGDPARRLRGSRCAAGHRVRTGLTPLSLRSP